MPAVDIPAIDRLTGRHDVTEKLVDQAGQLAVNLAVALLILVVTIWASGAAAKLLKRVVARFNAGHHLDTTLSNFLSNLVRYGILVVGLIAVLGKLGVQTTSILAVLGAASLAIGLALQGALSNVAAGVLLLILRPFRLGDLVEIDGKLGNVRNLDLFVTELNLLDGLRLIMPNSKVLGDQIINYTTNGRRRMQLDFRIDYADDVDAALALMLKQAAAEPRVLVDPAPVAQVKGLDDFGVVITLFAWSSTAEYGVVQPLMIKRIKAAFDAGGLTFPYPHQVGLTRAEQAKVRPKGKPAPDLPLAASPKPAARTSSRRRTP